MLQLKTREVMKLTRLMNSFLPVAQKENRLRFSYQLTKSLSVMLMGILSYPQISLKTTVMRGRRKVGKGVRARRAFQRRKSLKITLFINSHPSLR